MRLLCNGTIRIVGENPESPYLGHLISPRCGMSMEFALGTKLPLAADNGCFKAFEPDRFLAMLRKMEGFPRLAFVTAPDMVADADWTLKLFDDWKVEISGRGLPISLVAQDGLERREVPWDEIDAIFIGGSTGWKLGRHAARIAREAKSRGKWLHMGRVNSFVRFRHAYNLGCDSIDGSQFSWFPDTHIPKALDWLEELHRRPPRFPRSLQATFWD